MSTFTYPQTAVVINIGRLYYKGFEWGGRHFAIKDPNGMGVDIVTFTKPE